MEKFLGPRFLLLVLAGVALCSESSSNPSTQTTLTPSVTSATIPSSNKGQDSPNSSSTQPSTIPAVSIITPKHNSSQDVQTVTPASTSDNFTANISDSAFNTTFSTNLTSPTLIPTTPEKPTVCNYSLREQHDGIEVKIETNASEKSFNITFKSQGHEYTAGPRAGTSFKIPLKSLKPCKRYDVTVSHSCKPNNEADRVFTTKTFDVTHKVKSTDDQVEVCFDTKWDWGPCIPVNSNTSCTTQNLTFEDANCIKLPQILFPPVKPEINYTKGQYPIKLNWQNNPQQCSNNLTYSCNGSTDLQQVKPFHHYECNGTYNYEKEHITSNTISVKIDCPLNDPTLQAVKYGRIKAFWNLQSSSCSLTNTNFTWDVTCKEKNDEKKTQKRENCHSSPCVFDHLKNYTKYTCTFTAKYDTITIQSSPITERTRPAEPTIKEDIKYSSDNHNAFNVTCHIDDWQGDKGTFSAKLYIDNVLQHTTQSHEKCAFKFDNLYYLTEYTIKIYATNNNQNISQPLIRTYTTRYNDKAVLGILSFLIIITSLALLFVLYKIYLLKREKSRNEQELDDLLPTNTLLQVEPMSAEALLEAYKKKRADEGRLFMEEFQSIPRIFSNYTVREAKKSDNQPKNRYVDILPYDYNRVTLSHGVTGDYINCSFIEGYKESNKYIAAQGPKEETIGDFWTMIWEQKSSIIVMVTRCEEGNKTKCAQYWPSLERETEIYDDLVVKIKGQETCPDYVIRHLTLMNRKEKSAEREVTHIQFTSWPDHGVPTDPGLLLKLRRRVNSFKNFFSGPIVTHCSAGVGRTGTYICIDAMIESLEAEGRVDIYGYVVKLRRQRCLMVQVEAQYVLIHMALIEYSQFGETEMSLSDFHSEVNMLRQKEGNELSLIEMEFQKLPKFKNYRSSNTAHSEENKNKNRSSIVPYDFNRVPVKVSEEASHDSEVEDEDEYSSDEEDEIPTKYINASFVDGYWSPGSFIAAQGPMADTVGDFLHMLYQRRVKTVFMLTDCTENDKEFCAQYWDDEKKTFGEMEVEVKETENGPTYVKRCLAIQHTKRKDSHTLHQYHFLKWAGHELPPNPLDLVDMMRKVRQDSNHKDVPIVVHCNDGSSRSGVFCALWKLLDSADTEKLVDIFQVAKDLRKARLGVINSLEQYEFLYSALETAYPVQNGEVKKPSETPEDTVQVINESTALITPSTDAPPEEESLPKESTDSAPPAEGATEASSEPEKGPSESTANGPTATTIEV